MTIFFYVWNFFYTLINNHQNLFNKLFFKYNKTNLFYKTKYNNLVFFETIFLSFFFNIKKFRNPYFLEIYFNRKNNYPYFFVLHSNKILKKNKNNFKILKLFKKFEINVNNFNYVINNIYLNQSIFFFYKESINNHKLNFIFIYYLLNNIKNDFNFILQINTKNFNDFYNFFLNSNKNNYFLKIFNKKKIIKKNKKNSFKFKKININYFLYYYKFFLKNQKNRFFKSNIVLNLKNKTFSIKNYVSNITKYLNNFKFKNYNIMYLRKNKIFNKGRYSRNRQLYRTGVYWCLWLNIMLVYGLYFIFYRFSFNFGYIWWGCLILFYSTIFSRILKYNYISIFKIIDEFFNFFNWFGYIFKNLIINFIFKLKNIFYSFFYIKLFYSFFYTKILKINFIMKFINYFYNFKKVVYFYNFNSNKNISFLDYKFLFNWFIFVFKTILK